MTTTSRQFISLLFCIGLVISASAIANGQTRDKFVISAKAGGINAVTGYAKVHLKGGADWQQLSVTDDLEAGDMVQTDSGGRVEMLLNQGSYMRLGENSEFELVNGSLDKLEVKLLRGTAIVEATGADDTELLINITTPHTKLAIIRHGLYRFNVVPEDATELIVRKGRVMLGDILHTKVKGGNKVIFSATSVSVAKLEKEDKKDKDADDAWSKERADLVAQANRRLTDRELRNLFTSTFRDDWSWRLGGRSFGFWMFNARFGCYTFLPLYNGWGSPYGGSYSNPLFGNSFYYRGFRPIYSGGGGWTRSGGTTAGGNTGGGSGGMRTPPPSGTVTAPREVPAAAQRHIDRANQRMP